MAHDLNLHRNPKGQRWLVEHLSTDHGIPIGTQTPTLDLLWVHKRDHEEAVTDPWFGSED